MNTQAEGRDRRGGRSIKSRIGWLLENSTMSDLKFLVGEENFEFPGHKLVFAVSSHDFFNGFYAMTPADNIIRLPDIKVDSFKQFLSYIYTEEANINPENILDIIKLAERYEINHLMVFCYESAAEFIDTQMHLFDDLLKFSKLPIMKDLFWDKVSKDPLKYLRENNVEYLQKEHLKIILEAEDTKSSEKQLFELAVMWAMKKVSSDNPIKVKTILGDLLLLIRFPTMTVTEFEKCVQENDGILKSKDVIDILLYIGKKYGDCKYPTSKRNVKKNDATVYFNF